MGRTGNQIKELEDKIEALASLLDRTIVATQQELTRLEESITNVWTDHVEMAHR